MISKQEIAILRDLAERKAELAAEEKNQKRIRNWTRLNFLTWALQQTSRVYLALGTAGIPNTESGKEVNGSWPSAPALPAMRAQAPSRPIYTFWIWQPVQLSGTLSQQKALPI